MLVTDSPLASEIEATYCLKIGDFHFFKNFIVTEFNEGVNVSFDDFKEIYELSQEYFEGRPYGVISNRINSYSIDLIDILRHMNKPGNLRAYAIVPHHNSSRPALILEDHYFKMQRKRFYSIVEAAKWINFKIKKATESSKYHLP